MLGIKLIAILSAEASFVKGLILRWIKFWRYVLLAPIFHFLLLSVDLLVVVPPCTPPYIMIFFCKYLWYSIYYISELLFFVTF